MRGLTPRVMTLALLSAGLSAGCSLDRAPAKPGEASRYLFVWAGDPDSGDTDFLAVIDVDSASSSYGEVLATAPVGLSAGAHHTEHAMPPGGRLFANGFRSGQSWVVNLRDPLAPFVEATFDSVGPYTYPHSFERTPGRTVLATFQNRGEGNRLPGGLVELDSVGGVLDLSDPRHPALVDELELGPEAVPHWISLEPSGERIVLTGSGTLSGRVVLLRIDPGSGELSVIDDFGTGGGIPGVDMNREDWPHGGTGPARPHGAVFSLP